jgi:hypothetical protein
MADPEIVDPTPQNGVNQFYLSIHRSRQKATEDFLEFGQESRARLYTRRYADSPFPPQGFHPAEDKPQEGKAFTLRQVHLSGFLVIDLNIEFCQLLQKLIFAVVLVPRSESRLVSSWNKTILKNTLGDQVMDCRI